MEDGLHGQGDAGEAEVQRPGGCGRGAPGWRSGRVGMAPMEVTGYGLGHSGDTGSRGRRDRKGRVKVDSGDTGSRVKVESSCRTRWKGQEGAPRSSPTSALDRSAGVWDAALAALLAGRECGWVVNFAPPGSHYCLGRSNPPLPSGQPDPSPFVPSSPCSRSVQQPPQHEWCNSSWILWVRNSAFLCFRIGQASGGRMNGWGDPTGWARVGCTAVSVPSQHAQPEHPGGAPPGRCLGAPAKGAKCPLGHHTPVLPHAVTGHPGLRGGDRDPAASWTCAGSCSLAVIHRTPLPSFHFSRGT